MEVDCDVENNAACVEPPSESMAMKHVSEWVLEVVKSCDWREVALLNCLSKDFRRLLSDNPLYWRILCLKLMTDEKMYVKEDFLNQHPDLKALFFELWPLRKLFSGQGLETKETDELSVKRPEALKFSIQVCARFRPKVSTAGGKASEESEQVVLPLHQKVQVVMAAKEGTTRQEAMRYIMAERGYSRTVDPWENSEVRVPDKENMQNGTQTEVTTTSKMRGAHKAQVLSVNEDNGNVLTVAPGVGLREFEFDKVFGSSSKQNAVYNAAPRRLVMDFINGLNGSIIVYGQTGSGKTYTMFGPDPSELDSPYDAHRAEGIVPRVCMEVLQAKGEREALGFEVSVTLSYVEVYGAEVNDLLRGSEVVGQSRVAGQRYVLDGQSGQAMNSMAEVNRLLAKGNLMKRQAATAMNDRSSRAHSVVVLTMEQRDTTGDGPKMVSKLFLADLGGSEKLSKSKVDENVKGAGTVGWEEYYEGRERLQEATYINQGLFALKKCIDGLNDREQAAMDGRPDPYVPYQDSKLTMLLSSALGGNSKTLVVVTASTEPQHAVETVQVLRFGERCRNVANRAQMTGAALQRALQKIDEEVKECEQLIERFERWETIRMTRRDEFDGEELVVKSMLVGAEEHRERMEALLARRRELLGQPEPEMMPEQKINGIVFTDPMLSVQ